MIIPETKAIRSAMASFFFIEPKFDLQSNGIFPEKLPFLQRFLLCVITENCQLTTDN
jgi:hypothetical protein